MDSTPGSGLSKFYGNRLVILQKFASSQTMLFWGKKKIISFELIYLQGSNGHTDIEKRLTDTTGREGEGGTNPESRMETYTLPYVKQIVNGNLLHDSGNSKEAMLLGNPLATRKACHLFPTETGPLEHDSTDTIQSPLT